MKHGGNTPARCAFLCHQSEARDEGVMAITEEAAVGVKGSRMTEWPMAS